MSWKYGLKKINNYYELAEIYGKDCYTADPECIREESPDAVIKLLKMMLKDLEENLTVIDLDWVDKDKRKRRRKKH